jgi:hypothetical protein
MTDQQTEPTVDELRERAAELDVAGRSRMNREQLVEAIAAAETAAGESQIAADTSSESPPAPTPDEVGRPPLADVAADRARKREQTRRVIGDN